MRHGPARRTLVALVLGGLAVLVAPAPPPAHAASRNGVLSLTAQTRSGAGIYDLAPATGRVRLQPGSTPSDTYPAWSPDGRRVAFSRTIRPAGAEDYESETEVWVKNADGSGSRQLTDNDFRGPCISTPEDRAFGWSPDGTSVLYTSTAWNGGPDERPADARQCPLGTIFRAPLAGGVPSELGGRHGGCTNVVGAGVSRDGGRLAVLSQQLGCRDPKLLVADGAWGGLRALPAGPGIPFTVSWSPDASRLAYDLRRGRSQSVYVINADGTGRRRLATGSDPAWSPDGRRIAYVGYDSRRGGVVATVTPSGTGRKVLLAYERGPRPFLMVLALAWQPLG